LPISRPRKCAPPQASIATMQRGKPGQHLEHLPPPQLAPEHRTARTRPPRPAETHPSPDRARPWQSPT
jgi:hypothetical protein